MREIRTSGSMSGDGKRGGVFSVAIAPILDSTEQGGILPEPAEMQLCDHWRQKPVRHTVISVRRPKLPLKPHEIWLGRNWATKFMNKAG